MPLQVAHVADGAEGLALASGDGFALMIVDRMLPGMDGLTVVRTLRRREIPLPVLILSAIGDCDARVTGLSEGADDYLPKPFSLDELAARVAALLRRGAMATRTRLVVGSLELDLIDRGARRGDRTIELMPTEFKLLEYLMLHRDQVVTRAMLLRDVWHYNLAVTTNVVDVHVGKLRRKIDGDGDPPLIESIRGKGFMLSADAIDH